jgi:hypothetical protein
MRASHAKKQKAAKPPLPGFADQTVVVVTASCVVGWTGEPLLLVAATATTATRTPTPSSTQAVVPNCACATPAGLPGASGPTSAANADEAIKVVDKAKAIRVRIFPLDAFFFL